MGIKVKGIPCLRCREVFRQGQRTEVRGGFHIHPVCAVEFDAEIEARVKNHYQPAPKRSDDEQMRLNFEAEMDAQWQAERDREWDRRNEWYEE